MELLDIGRELKAAREDRGLSIEKVYEETRIGVNFIKSLEQGRAEDLPHSVYAQAFVRSYAKYLNLDWERIVKDFAGLYTAEDQFEKINMDDLPTSLRTTKNDIRTPRYAILISMVLSMVIVIGVGWLLYSVYKDKTDNLEPDPAFHDAYDDPSTADQTTPPYVREPWDHPAAADADDPSPQAETDEELLSLDTAVEPEHQEDDPADETEIAGDRNADPEPEVKPAEPDPYQDDDAAADTEESILIIQAREDCWLMIMADQSSREAYLRAGESVRVGFKHDVQVTLGNAGGVDLYLNGDPYPFEAASGEVKTIKIPYDETDT